MLSGNRRRLTSRPRAVLRVRKDLVGSLEKCRSLLKILTLGNRRVDDVASDNAAKDDRRRLISGSNNDGAGVRTTDLEPVGVDVDGDDAAEGNVNRASRPDKGSPCFCCKNSR